MSMFKSAVEFGEGQGTLAGAALGAALGGGGTLIHDLLRGKGKGNRLRRALMGSGVGLGVGAVGGNMAGRLAESYAANEALGARLDRVIDQKEQQRAEARRFKDTIGSASANDAVSSMLGVRDAAQAGLDALSPGESGYADKMIKLKNIIKDYSNQLYHSR